MKGINGGGKCSAFAGGSMELFGSGLNLPQCLRLYKGTILAAFAVRIPVKIDNLALILVLDSAYISVLLLFLNGIAAFEILYDNFWYLKYL